MPPGLAEPGSSFRRSATALSPALPWDSDAYNWHWRGCVMWNPFLQALHVCFVCKIPLTRRCLSKTRQTSFSIRLSLQGQVLGPDWGKHQYSRNITSGLLPGSNRLRIPLLQEEQMREESQTESFHCHNHLQTGEMLSGSSFGYTNKESN